MKSLTVKFFGTCFLVLGSFILFYIIVDMFYITIIPYTKELILYPQLLKPFLARLHDYIIFGYDSFITPLLIAVGLILSGIGCLYLYEWARTVVFASTTGAFFYYFFQFKDAYSRARAYQTNNLDLAAIWQNTPTIIIKIGPKILFVPMILILAAYVVIIIYFNYSEVKDQFYHPLPLENTMEEEDDEDF